MTSTHPVFLGSPAFVSEAAVIGEPPEMRGFRHDEKLLAHPVELEEGVTIEALVTIDAGLRGPTRVGARTWLMKKVHVGHDAVVGADCEIAPLTSIGGHVTIGDRVKVGQGATFKPYVRVGDDAVIGMGSVVTKDVPALEVWVGNPARKLRDVEPRELLPPDPYTMAFQLCDEDGIVRRGLFHKGTDYPCTGHAHRAGEHIRCTSPAHEAFAGLEAFLPGELQAPRQLIESVNALGQDTCRATVTFGADLYRCKRGVHPGDGHQFFPVGLDS